MGSVEINWEYIDDQIFLNALRGNDSSRTVINKHNRKNMELEDIHYIRFTNSELKELPYNIKALRNLQYLDISGSMITKIPNSIGELSNLNYLCLSGCNIEKLPDSLGVLNNLSTIKLNNTEIDELPVFICQLKNLKVLDLSGCKIKQLPASLGDLSNLNELILTNSEIEELPDTIGQLTSLQTLDLKNSRIKTIPDSIKNNVALQAIDISGTYITELPEGIGECKSLLILSASKTAIKSLPDSIGRLKLLRGLYLRETLITTLPESVGDLADLKSLNISKSSVIELPTSICNLHSLQSFSCGESRITSLPEDFGKLESLQSLDLSGCAILDLPKSICNLDKLLSLDLRYSQIRELPECIGGLKALQRLNLRGSKISELPENIGELKYLQDFNISETNIKVLPDSIGSLKNLQIFALERSSICKVPQAIGNLGILSNLDLSHTNITELPDSIGNIGALQILNLHNSSLRVLPQSIVNLKRLVELNLSNTKLNTLPEEIGNLSSISRLILENLSLESLPYSLLKTGLDFIYERNSQVFLVNGIYINNLTLSKQPISLFQQNKELIKKYFEEEKIPVKTAKVIILGDGDAGKTYTLKRLLNNGKKDTYPTKPTHGVLIKPYPITIGDQQFVVKLWDFGGQQIMHSLHRCFLTERSCYIVMLSSRYDRDLMKQARDWLRTINTIAPKSPIIVIVNQFTNNILKVDEPRLKKEFGNIKKFLYLSVVDAEVNSFLEIKEAIVDQILCLDSYEMELPKSWHDLIVELQDEKTPYIRKETYYNKCFKKGIVFDSDESNDTNNIYDWLLDWFNDLGVCFSYHRKTNSKRLDNYALLNPEWLTRAAYCLINEGCSVADNGILRREDIEDILSNTEPLDFDELGSVTYKSFEIDYILEILRKFFISYNLYNNMEFVPVLCDEYSIGRNIPSWYDPDDNFCHHTSYEFKYTYLPEVVIHRLMIFCYQSHYNISSRWRKGMSVDFDKEASSGLTAIIDAGNEHQSITIDIYSDGHIPCWKLLLKLREEILLINEQLNLNAKDYIIMETNGIQDSFPVDAILKRRARGKEDFPATYYDGDYEISEILGSAYGPINTKFLEKAAELQNGEIPVERLSQIFDMLDQVVFAVGQLNDRLRDVQILTYLQKDEMNEGFTKMIQNQNNSIALINTLKKDPLSVKRIARQILAGTAVAADFVTIVQFCNPGISVTVAKEISEVLESFLPLL